jgi:hypothetical protein
MLQTRRRVRLAPLALITLLAAAPLLGGTAPEPTCIAGTEETFSFTGSLQTYDLPPGSLTVTILARGASGGNVPEFVGDARPEGETGGPYLGGLGAIAYGVMAVTGGGALDVIVGGEGETFAPDPDRPEGKDLGNEGGGGGGGSAVMQAGAALVFAGGGGGAGVTEDGSDAEQGEDGGDANPEPRPEGGGPAGGPGGTGGSGGGGGTNGGSGGGGGGFLSDGTDGAGGLGSFSGLGGNRLSPPGDAAGGEGTEANGGYGGGGGGGDVGGGGGGGYSGGGGGWGPGVDGGGGGGSFVSAAATEAVFDTAGAPGDGEVFICVTSAGVPFEIPALGERGLLVLTALLALAGTAVLMRRRRPVSSRA